MEGISPANLQSLFAGFVLHEFGAERRQFVQELFPEGWQEIDLRL